MHMVPSMQSIHIDKVLKLSIADKRNVLVFESAVDGHSTHSNAQLKWRSHSKLETN